MVLDQLKIEALFAGDPWLGSLPAERRRALLGASHLRHFHDGESIYRLGDDPDGIYGIISGAVRMLNYPVDGGQLMNGIIRTGRWFGEISVLDGGPRPHDALAMGPTALACVPLSAWRRLASASPSFTEDLARLSCQRIRAVLVNINDFMTRSAESRLARILLDLTSHRPDRGDGPPGVRLCQEDVADLVGVSRQSVNRILRQFETKGLVSIGYARVSVLQREGLSAYLD